MTLFGVKVAIADLTGDGYGDLIIRDNGEDYRGSIVLIPGTFGGISPASASRLDPPPGDSTTFGYGLAIGDFSGSGELELAVNTADGQVLLYSARTGSFDPAPNATFSQSTPGVPGVDEESDAWAADCPLLT